MPWLLPLAAAADLPVESLRYTVDVSGPLAEVVLEQTFHNDQGAPIDATYVFPLHEDAAVDSMRIEIGDRVIEAEILEREEAAAVFQAARDAGRVAALTEQQRPNVFTQRVANIPAGATIVVRIGVVEPVPRLDGAYELVLPLVVAPRFSADPADALEDPHPVDEQGVPADGPPPRVDIDVDVHAAVPVVAAASPTHPIDLAIDGEGLGASVYDAEATRDFVLRWQTTATTPQAGMLVHGETGLLMLEPPAIAPAVTVPREVVWVLDTSGSMEGEKITIARRVILAAIDRLGPDETFAVLRFSDDVSGPFARPVPATKANRARARAYVGLLRSDGGTRMVEAVEAALALPDDPARHRVIALVTDGEISADEALLRKVAAEPGVSFSAIGVGPSPNRHVLTELARVGTGAAAYITLDEPIRPALDRVIRAFDGPVLQELVVEWGAWQVDAPYPARFRDAVVGMPQWMAVHLAGGSGPVRISGASGEGTWSQVVTPVFVEGARAVEATWARARVADLHRRHLEGELADEVPEILALGLRWHIVTAYTSLVAVERRGEDLVADAVPPAHDVVLTREYLARIPGGRTYQLAGSSAAGVTGTFSANFDFDALDLVSWRGPPDGMGAPLAMGPEPIEPGENSLRQQVGAKGGYATAGFGALALAVSGRLVRDRAWVAGAVDGRLAADEERQVEALTTRVRFTLQPTATHRFEVEGAVAPAVEETSAGDAHFGQDGVRLGWDVFFSPRTQARLAAQGWTGSVRDDHRDIGEVSAGFDAQDLDLLGKHAPRLGVSALGARWAGAERGQLGLASAFVGDTWSVPNVDARVRLAGAALFAPSARFIAEPRGFVRWDPLSERLVFTIEGGRAWDRDLLRLGVLAEDGLPGRTDSGELTADLRLGTDTHIVAFGEVADDRVALAPGADFFTADQAGNVAWLDDTGIYTGLAVRQDLVRRVWAGVRWRHAASPPGDTAPAASALAFWAGDRLDAWRRHVVRADVGWRLPTDPVGIELWGWGRWASAIAGEGPWWFAAKGSAGLTGRVDLSAPRGLRVEVEAAVGRNDPDFSVFFRPALVSAGVPEPGVAPPVAVWASVRYER